MKNRVFLLIPTIALLALGLGVGARIASFSAHTTFVILAAVLVPLVGVVAALGARFVDKRTSSKGDEFESVVVTVNLPLKEERYDTPAPSGRSEKVLWRPEGVTTRPAHGDNGRP
jgi:membrane protein implicated in regulation of membrane protease activity